MKKHIDEVRKEAAKSEIIVDTGDCSTCKHLIGLIGSGFCKLGNDIHRSYCCYHSEYDELVRKANKKALRDHCENTHQMLLDALKDSLVIMDDHGISDIHSRPISKVIEAASYVEVEE
jgi:hypothetical protein